MSEQVRVVRCEPSGSSGSMALIGPDGRALSFTREEDGAEIAATFLAKDAQLKALADGLREISQVVGVARQRHLTSCLRYGGRVFDEHKSACTAECAAIRPALDLLESLP